jgi:uncharacterized RDD family membrane protein YckC
VDLEDRITIGTPEGVQLEIALAGAASRFIAGVIDLTIQFVLIVLAALAAFGLLGSGLGTAVFAMAAFALVFLYPILFEVLAQGRTPGKRLTHLRVVRGRGTPVDVPASAVRNLMRLIDQQPFPFSLVGLLAIFITKNNQRLGDLAAGTLVIRDRPTEKRRATGDQAAGAASAIAGPAASAGSVASTVAGWDVSAVTAEEIAAVRRFLARRDQLDAGARAALAYRLEQGLRAKVAGASDGTGPERFLELLVAAKAQR